MHRRKILVIGQAPSRDTDGKAPFSGRSGRKLASLMGVDHDVFPELFDFANVLDRWPGKCGKGDAFPAGEVKTAASRLDVADRPLVLLVGKNVARAFGETKRSYFDPFDLRGSKAAVVPHPSGVNRWWNDEENRTVAAQFFTSLADAARSA